MDEQDTAVQEVTVENIRTAVTGAAELLRIRQGQGLHLTEVEAQDIRLAAARIKHFAIEMESVD